MVLFASCPGFSLGFGGSFSPSSFKGEKCRGAHHICHITFQIQEMQRQLPLEVLFTNTNARIVTFRLALQQWKRVGRILVMSSEHGVISVLKHSLGFDIWLPKENFNKKNWGHSSQCQKKITRKNTCRWKVMFSLDHRLHCPTPRSWWYPAAPIQRTCADNQLVLVGDLHT